MGKVSVLSATETVSSILRQHDVEVKNADHITFQELKITVRDVSDILKELNAIRKHLALLVLPYEPQDVQRRVTQFNKKLERHKTAYDIEVNKMDTRFQVLIKQLNESVNTAEALRGVEIDEEQLLETITKPKSVPCGIVLDSTKRRLACERQRKHREKKRRLLQKYAEELGSADSSSDTSPELPR